MKVFRIIAGHLFIVFLLASAIHLLAESGPPSVRFTDVTRPAGITFTHYTGAFGQKYLPETLGPGIAFIDYDGDGWQDLFFTNGKDWPGQRHRAATLHLYHNNHNGTFTDVTRVAGLAVEAYALGVAVGDYDNDGDDDLFVTTVGQSLLFRNTRGVFTDVTKESGLAGHDEFSTSAAWVDVDRDGSLDLVVGNYVRWTPQTNLFCTLDGTNKSYCTPESYKGASVRLWRSRGNGTFEDLTSKAGLLDDTSKTLGVAILDVNNDLWPDLVFANDTQPNRLYVNNGKGGFTEQGVRSGIAFSEEGIARAGMGVDAADYDRSGYPSVMITNFANQMLAVYHNEGNGLFVDEAPRSAVGRASLLTLGFGCFFFDYDLDGWLDIFVANGHIERDIERIQSRIKYAEPPHVFRNSGKGAFALVTSSLGPAMQQPRVGRGAVYGDFDNDGDLDVVLTTNGGPAYLFHNEGGNRNGFLRVELKGARSNRSAIGAVVRVKSASGTQWQMVKSGSSYCSQSELALTFGLGAAARADTVEVLWPSGTRQSFSNIPEGHLVSIEEGRPAPVLTSLRGFQKQIKRGQSAAEPKPKSAPRSLRPQR